MTRKPITGEHRGTYAGADFAFRKDASGLVIVRRFREITNDAIHEMRYEQRPGRGIAIGKFVDRFKVVCDRQWVPTSTPLRVTKTIEEAAEIAETYGCDTMTCDLHYIESVREVLETFETLTLREFPSDSDGINKAYIRVRVLLQNGLLDLSEASDGLIQQLKETEAKPSATGLAISHPRVRGSHGDLVPALVAAIYTAEDPEIQAATVGSRRFDGSRRFGPAPGGWREYAPKD